MQKETIKKEISPKISIEVKLQLVQAAIKARQTAYTPYSHFQVGAALLTAKGEIYTGGNIENASYGATNCAERTAFYRAVSEGNREFRAIAIAGGAEGQLPTESCYPCGICRQVMQEFCDGDFLILIARCKAGAAGDTNRKEDFIPQTEYTEHTLAELLPHGFGGEALI